jgi:hypothetical protein
MVERIRLNPKKNGNFSEVGYCKPPTSTQFKPGRSGNPAGRPKGSRNFKTELRATLQTPVNVNRNGRVRKFSTQRASLLVLREKALNGDQRANEHLINLAVRFDDEPNGIVATGLGVNDRAILDAYVKEAIAKASEAVTGPDRNELTDDTKNSSPADGSPNERDYGVISVSSH